MNLRLKLIVSLSMFSLCMGTEKLMYFSAFLPGRYISDLNSFARSFINR